MTDIGDRPHVPASSSARPVATGSPQQWVGLGVVLIGTLIVALDSTIVAIALPQIGRALDAGQSVQWVVTANLLAVAVSMPAAGWIANRLGAKRVFLTSLALFSLASLAAALAPSLGALIVARALQGLCAGIINPISMTIVLDLFAPAERGRAIGVWGLVAMTAPAVGPTLGGYLVTSVSWHWLFLPNVPLGIAGAIAGRRLLADSPPRPRTSLDVVGLLLGASGLALFLFTLAQSRRWGWAEPITVVGLNALPDVALPQASTLRSLTNQAGAATVVAFLFTIVNARLASARSIAASQHAYNVTFQIAMVALVLAIGVASRMPGRPQGV